MVLLQVPRQLEVDTYSLCHTKHSCLLFHIYSLLEKPAYPPPASARLPSALHWLVSHAMLPRLCITHPEQLKGQPVAAQLEQQPPARAGNGDRPEDGVRRRALPQGHATMHAYASSPRSTRVVYGELGAGGAAARPPAPAQMQDDRDCRTDAKCHDPTKPTTSALLDALVGCRTARLTRSPVVKSTFFGEPLTLSILTLVFFFFTALCVFLSACVRFISCVMTLAMDDGTGKSAMLL